MSYWSFITSQVYHFPHSLTLLSLCLSFSLFLKTRFSTFLSVSFPFSAAAYFTFPGSFFWLGQSGSPWIFSSRFLQRFEPVFFFLCLRPPCCLFEKEMNLFCPDGSNAIILWTLVSRNWLRMSLECFSTILLGPKFLVRHPDYQKLMKNVIGMLLNTAARFRELKIYWLAIDLLKLFFTITCIYAMFAHRWRV